MILAAQQISARHSSTPKKISIRRRFASETLRAACRQTLLRSRVARNRDGTGYGTDTALAFETLDFLQGFRREIRLTTMRAVHHGNILDDQQVAAFAVRFTDLTDARTRFTAEVANDLFERLFFHKVYTVITTSLPVGLNFATTSTARPSVASP